MISGFEMNLTMLAMADASAAGAVAGQLAAVIVCSMGWLFLAPKINADAIRAKLKRELWSGMYLLTGVIALLLWLVIPIFAIGMVVFFLLVLGILLTYVLYRNSLMDEPEDKLFTKEWFASRKTVGPKEVHLETRLKLYDHIGRIVQLTESEFKDVQLVQGYNLTQALLYDIVFNRAGEVDMAPTGEQIRLKYVIDGVVSTRESISLEDSEYIIPFLLERAGIDMESQGHDQVQKGKITVDLASSPMTMELFVKETVAGPRIRIRVIQQLVQTNIDMLGMQPNVISDIIEITNTPGLLIVSGPPKSGVTSTMYSILRKQDAYMKLLMTVESKSPLDMENVTQHEYGDISKLPTMLATTMRRDPDVILVDQCPDEQTARMICDFAKEKFVILGLPAKDSFSGLLKWLKTMGGSSQALTPLRGIICQTLVRSLCPTCKSGYNADAQTTAKLNLMRVRAGIAEPMQEIYRPPEFPRVDEKGKELPPCDTCQDTGYYGRTGVFEFLRVDDNLLKLMKSKATMKQLKEHAKNSGMLSIYEQALCKVSQGVTSVQEVLRVCKPETK